MDNFLIKTVKDATNEELNIMMDKYKEKLVRYSTTLNEETDRTKRKILMIHMEQVKRNKLQNNI